MFRCYTLAKDGVSEGIDTESFECIVSEKPGTMKLADLQLLPVLPGIKPDPGTIQLCLSFLHDCTGSTDKPDTGAILSVDPLVWRMCTEKSPMRLLDPSGSNGHVLLLIQAHGANLFVNAFCPTMVVGSDFTGRPTIGQVSRAAVMLSALGITKVSAERRRGLPKPVSKGHPRSRRTTPQLSRHETTPAARTASPAT